MEKRVRRKHKIYLSYRAKRRIIFTISALIVLVLYMLKNTSFFVRASSAISSLVIFYLADHFFDIRFKPRHYFFMTFIAITGFLLSPLYFIYPQYDKILHILFPLLLSSIAFHMISELDLKLKWQLTFTFFIVIGSLGIFELGEFALDKLFDLKLQGVWHWDSSGLEKLNVLQNEIDDTMVDLLLGVLSAGIYWISIICINYREFFKLRT